jgi:hypothetical protein
VLHTALFYSSTEPGFLSSGFFAVQSVLPTFRKLRSGRRQLEFPVNRVFIDKQKGKMIRFFLGRAHLPDHALRENSFRLTGTITKGFLPDMPVF